MTTNFSANTLGTSSESNTQNSAHTILKVSFFILGAMLVLFFSASMVSGFKEIWTSLKEKGIAIVTKTVGTEMKKDENGNVNVLLLWYGGNGHDGGFLTDSIIIASRNPEVGTVSMFSIPRDLRVKYTTGGYGRINVSFYLLLKQNNDDRELATSWARAEFWKMLGLDIPYYATIDFTAFKGLVDAVGGIDIVVPETIHDTTYPNDANRWYITFHIDAWEQHLDGATALKYARSRHSTSDFSRSLRQQIILKGIKEKLVNSGFSTSTALELYDVYAQYIKTNIASQELLWASQFIKNIGEFSSFGFTTNCSFQNFLRMVPACFLYYPSRELFWGASVMLPMDATPKDIQHYEDMQKFTQFITSHPQMIKEKTSISVVSAIDSQLAKDHRMGNTKFNDQLAVKLKRYWFNVIDSMIRADPMEYSTVSVNNIGDYTATIEALKTFIPDLRVEYNTWNIQSWRDENGNPITFVEGADITVILGNDYLLGSPTMSGLVETKFSFKL